MLPDWFVAGLPALPDFVVLATVSLLAGVMRGFAGFGSGLLMAPVFSLVLSPTDTLAVILLLHVLTVFQILPAALRTVDWGLVLRLLVPALLGVPLGLFMVHSLDAALMRKTVGLVVIVVALLMLRGWYYAGRRGRVQDTVAGALSGFMTAISGIGGPPLVLYLLSDRSVTPVIFRSVMIVFFFFTQMATLVPFTLSGSLSLYQTVFVVLLLPVFVLATQLGSVLHRYAAQKHQALARRVCLVFLLVTGALALLV
ncbi:MAG: sulfite exporter TauE/SafE family protein [Alcaligenaceae bacterium]|nr:sulfite exporter TauE/SafE family protein [Alcaligenaceae bacterium]